MIDSNNFEILRDLRKKNLNKNNLKLVNQREFSPLNYDIKTLHIDTVIITQDTLLDYSLCLKEMLYSPGFKIFETELKDFEMNKLIVSADMFFGTDTLLPEIFLSLSYEDTKTGKKYVYKMKDLTMEEYSQDEWNVYYLEIDLPKVKKNSVFKAYIWNKNYVDCYLRSLSLYTKTNNLFFLYDR